MSAGGTAVDADRALHQLCASMDACERDAGPWNSGGTTAAAPAQLGTHHARMDWPLPSLPEDPLSASMGSSGGLIAWSKNLYSDDPSPQATLASFFQPA